jgi:hypothetical protein
LAVTDENAFNFASREQHYPALALCLDELITDPHQSWEFSADLKKALPNDL